MQVKRFFVSIGIVFMAGACANPKYPSQQSFQVTQENSTGACSVKFVQSGDCVDVHWEKMPSDGVYGSFIFKIYRLNLGDGSEVVKDPELLPSVLLWMPSMGHPSSPVTVEKLDVGTYRASRVYFVMPGSWEIRFQEKTGNEIKDEAVLKLTI